MPRLRVLAGTSLDSLVPITDAVNTNKPVPLCSHLFDGQVVANIKGFNGISSEYFDREDRRGITWSIQVQGRFLKPFSADDIMFGNTFDRPLHLPWGSNVALKFMNYIDPTLEHDLTSNSKPWALSPLVATMPHFVHTREKDTYFPPDHSLSDDTSQLHLALVDFESPMSSASSSGLSSPRHRSSSDSSSSSSSSQRSMSRSLFRSKKCTMPCGPFNFRNAAQRRAHFSDPVNRDHIVFGPKDTITTDFCYGFIEFSPTLSLRLPGGVSFDLKRYWDGQPVRFVCCERRKDDDPEPWGQIFWCVVVEAVD